MKKAMKIGSYVALGAFTLAPLAGVETIVYIAGSTVCYALLAMLQ